MSDKLSGIRSKIERTKKHVADLDVAIRTFLDSNPYKVGTERDPNTRKMVYYVVSVRCVDPDVTQIAGDAIGNMVSILDHLAFRLFKKHTPSGDGIRVQFPIARNATTTAKYVSDCQGKVQGIEPLTVIPDLLSLEAYKGGKGHQLWVLNELNNLAKHRDLIAVGSRFKSVGIPHRLHPEIAKLLPPGDVMPEFYTFIRPADPLCPLKNGDILYVDAPDAEPDDKIKFKFDVALSETQIIHAEPMIETVHQLSGVVDGIVGHFVKYL